MRKSDEEFNISMADKHGYVPDINLIGAKIRHNGNGKTYVIAEFVWMGSTDEWGYLHHREDSHPVSVVRPVTELSGKLIHGEPRYAFL